MIILDPGRQLIRLILQLKNGVRNVDLTIDQSLKYGIFLFLVFERVDSQKCIEKEDTGFQTWIFVPLIEFVTWQRVLKFVFDLR